MVNINLRVLTRPEASALPTITQMIGTDYDQKASAFVFLDLASVVMKSISHHYLLLSHRLTSKNVIFCTVLDDFICCISRSFLQS